MYHVSMIIPLKPLIFEQTNICDLLMVCTLDGIDLACTNFCDIKGTRKSTKNRACK